MYDSFYFYTQSSPDTSKLFDHLLNIFILINYRSKFNLICILKKDFYYRFSDCFFEKRHPSFCSQRFVEFRKCLSDIFFCGFSEFLWCGVDTCLEKFLRGVSNNSLYKKLLVIEYNYNCNLSKTFRNN